MTGKVFAKSVQGASHIRQNKICQDSNYWCKNIENAVIVAVADGHGSESCIYSDEGAYRAVHAFCDIMQELITKDGFSKDTLKPLVDDNKLLAKRITSLWRKRVARKHRDEHRGVVAGDKTTKKRTSIGNVIKKANKSNVDYMLYGTTLLGIAVVDKMAVVYQLGDGDIQLVTKDEVRPLVDADKFLGVETYSLSNDMSWNYAKVSVVDLTDLNEPFLIMLSTDGLSNSYINTTEFNKCCSDYLAIIQEDGFSYVKKHLEEWLRDTSDNGCGDDVTVALAYFTEMQDE